MEGLDLQMCDRNVKCIIGKGAHGSGWVGLIEFFKLSSFFHTSNY